MPLIGDSQRISFVSVAGSFGYIDQRIDFLSHRCRDSLVERGFHPDQIHTEAYLHMRYDRTDCALLCGALSSSTPNQAISSYGDFQRSFIEKYPILLKDPPRFRFHLYSHSGTKQSLASVLMAVQSLLTTSAFEESPKPESKLLKLYLMPHQKPSLSR